MSTQQRPPFLLCLEALKHPVNPHCPGPPRWNKKGNLQNHDYSGLEGSFYYHAFRSLREVI